MLAPPDHATSLRATAIHLTYTPSNTTPSSERPLSPSLSIVSASTIQLPDHRVPSIAHLLPIYCPVAALKPIVSFIPNKHTLLIPLDNTLNSQLYCHRHHISITHQLLRLHIYTLTLQTTLSTASQNTAPTPLLLLPLHEHSLSWNNRQPTSPSAMSIFSRFRRSRKQAKEKNEAATKQKQQANPAPYRHTPRHAASDSISSGPSGARAADEAHIREANHRRSAMTVVSPEIHMGSPRFPRVASSASCSNSVAGSSVYSRPGFYSNAGSPSSRSISIKGKEVDRGPYSPCLSPSSSKGSFTAAYRS